ncbi:putative multifunctional folic acid synthesis protein [Cryphonectria parasitica EP155]|uniref:Folic acid synthesis protein FOL1 n=1 Tax=Cryphonectria parasitica (strain ATCC 38755 / EP155) TaxID=660469 RepID=A0A9P5CRU2_CRYP1|nr:putative multifunctional folic acid synthesis protein [Cryphonectria parasitica EP155]KAF3767631.1 putative multifunctional folic acid synthesis protein [Cryphonectria parasitica EP155]
MATGKSKQKTARTAYIALGSNLGDRIAEIERACREMDARGIRVKRTSSLWETEPMYYADQDRFVNGTCEVETTLEPLALLDQLQEIERLMGRKKVIDKGPRNIDLDILLYEDEAVNHERLKVPHVGILEREFVLRPLAELIPTKAIFPKNPWKFTQDYLNELPPSSPPLTTLTPLSHTQPPLQALKPSRKTHVMAILNMTPDSFSDGGTHATSSLADTIRTFIASGATMIDVGGQSTAPSRPEVSADEELSRVVPAIKLIRAQPGAEDVLISVDTYRARVAEAAVQAGADIVNDVSAGAMDPEMFPTMARLGKTVCLMHMRGTPATMSSLNDYGGSSSSSSDDDALVPAIAKELLERVAAAEAAGVRRWRIILDPGLGFAKVGAQNLTILRRLRELREWPGLQNLPWLVGSSRKSFIGKVTGVARPAERIWGTAATVAAAVEGGADVVRVHDVKEMGQVVKMSDAIWRY